MFSLCSAARHKTGHGKILSICRNTAGGGNTPTTCGYFLCVTATRLLKENNMNKKISYVPLYEQVKKDILRRIIAGDWSPGSFLPNEFALAEQYGVSQGTLRKALNELTAEKYLVRYQGKGTAVAVVEDDSSLFPFFFLSRRDNKHIPPISQVTGISKTQATAEIARHLQIEENDDILEIKRVRILDNECVINETVYVSLKVTGDIRFEEDQTPNTLYVYYQHKCGIRVHRIVEDIEAVLPNSDDIKRLNIPKNQPVMKISRTSFDIQERIVEYRISKINTSHYTYRIDLK